jgi:hypothetical protein
MKANELFTVHDATVACRVNLLWARLSERFAAL